MSLNSTGERLVVEPLLSYPSTLLFLSGHFEAGSHETHTAESLFGFLLVLTRNLQSLLLHLKTRVWNDGNNQLHHHVSNVLMLD